MTKKSRRVAKTRRALLTLSLVLVVAFAAVGGTVAWLTDKTDAIVNTFTTSDIDITLTENADEDATTEGHQFKMVPGKEITKDPVVTVQPGSEASWLFVEVTKSANFDACFTWSVDTTWTELESDASDNGLTTVYYIQQAAVAEGADAVAHPVLTGNKVTVNNQITKTDMTALESNKPTLTFTAYAVQQEKLTVEQAWAQAQELANYGAIVTASN